MKYLIVVFKNKKRKKIIKKFKTLERAEKYYKTKLSENLVIFDKKVENGRPCNFELGILEKDSNDFESYYIKDEMGRQVKVELDDPDYKIMKINDYKVEELLFDKQTNKKITFLKFVKKYLPISNIKLVSKLNHKIIVQRDEIYSIFSLKSDDDCERFLDVLREYLFTEGRGDCILVSDTSKPQKKYLYNVLEESGIPKSVLYRRSTTFIRE